MIILGLALVISCANAWHWNPSFMRDNTFDSNVNNSLQTLNRTLHDDLNAIDFETVETSTDGRFVRFEDEIGQIRNVFVPLPLLNYAIGSGFDNSTVLPRRHSNKTWSFPLTNQTHIGPIVGRARSTRWSSNTTRIKRSNRLCYERGDPGSNDINMRAICPWKFVTDYSATRKPHELLVAECLCNSQCLHHYNARCQEYKYRMRVKVKRGDAWHTEYHFIPVSCYCTF